MGKISFQLDASFCLGMMFWSLKSGLWVCISNLFLISHDRLKHCDTKFSHKFQSCFVTAHIVASNTFHWNRVGEGFLLGFFGVMFNLKCFVPQSKESVICWILYFVCLIKGQTGRSIFQDTVIPFTLKPLPSCCNAKTWSIFTNLSGQQDVFRSI